MELKDYQRRVLERLDDYLATLRLEYDKSLKATEALKAAGVEIPAGLDDFPKNAWTDLKKKHLLPHFKTPVGFIIPDHAPRYDARQRSVPHICMKVPTGGGKTLLGAEGVGRVQTAFFRKQTGLVLWIVPTVQIYRQTWKPLANREHAYRQILERASGGRVKFMEKDDSFSKADTDHYLCIMLVRLAAANRATGKDFLKIFRDSGKYTGFFPEVDDYNANNALLNLFPDLEVNDFADAGAFAGISIKQSLVNVLKICRPVVVIDEGHKAYSENTRAALNNFNPSFVMELTATPNVKHHVSNVLVDVSGVDLKNEQMIKLPINITNAQKSDWKNTLNMAAAKLDGLDRDSHKVQDKDGRYIRPIMVIRVERTGKDQRDGKKIHALDAKDYLLEKLSVREDQIRIKSADTDELGDEDLLDPLCPVRFIITKEALQEGWDCPFAYILALLDKTTAKTALTQMIGRILRQPDTRTTTVQSMNECYVFCFDQNVKEAVDNVRKGLEDEGMTGLGDFVRATDPTDGGGEESPEPITIKRNKKFPGLQIFLPKVMHKQGKDWRDLAYDQDILACVNWEELRYDPTLYLDGKDSPSVTTTQIDVARKDLPLQEQQELELVTKTINAPVWMEKKLDVSFLSRQLMDVVPNPWQASRIILEILKTLTAKGADDESLYSNRIFLADSIKNDLKKKVHEQTEAIFRDKLKKGDITFHLLTTGDKVLSYAIAEELQMLAKRNERRLAQKNGFPPENTLFEYVLERDLNNLEKDFALYMCDDQTVTWWHRMVSRTEYGLQGWQRNKVYPDFIACVNGQKLVVLETKGLQLKGNDDTEYKQRLMNMLTDYHRNAIKAGEISLTDGHSKPLTLAMLMEDDWRNEFQAAKTDSQ